MSFEASLPEGRKRRFTDAQLRSDLAEGMKPAAIAKKHGVSHSAVSQRVKQLGISTVAQVAPHESRKYVASTIDAMEQLSKNLRSANLIQDACDRWLRDADDPTQYDVGPRSDEVLVTYTELGAGGQRLVRKKWLSELLDLAGHSHIDGVEIKQADPRELILKSLAEARQTINTCASLAKMLADVQGMQTFREVILFEIAKADPDVAARIREAVQRSLALQGVLDAPPDVRWNGVN